MATYYVGVVRTSCFNLTVQAKNKKEAKEYAIEAALNGEGEYGEPEYEVTEIEKGK